MYEPYTRQSLPSKEYRELLGSALCVFSSNNGFIIENIIHTSNAYDWYNLIDLESGKLKKSIADTISRNTGNKDIEILFSEHSFFTLSLIVIAIYFLFKFLKKTQK